jgi:hypothetical protein
MLEEWWIVEDLKGSGRNVFEGTVATFALRDWGKQWETSVNIASLPVEIRTENLPNISLERNCNTKLFGVYL